MIRVRRSLVPVPSDLEGPSSKGQLERSASCAFYRLKSNRHKPFEYKAYKLDSVAEALEELFHGKCAYCESYYRRVQPVDIEHFRPKGGFVVTTKSGKPKLEKPGYYWLAAEWSNLLPSCIDCNRERTHEFPEEGVGKGGKANRFPIEDETSRAKKPGKESAERPLLLNPCDDPPEAHLVFDRHGNIIPKKGSRKGKESIAVYGLRRPGLVHCREERALLIMATIRRLKRIEARKLASPHDVAIDDELRDEMAELKRFVDPRAEYSAMAMQLVKRHYRPL